MDLYSYVKKTGVLNDLRGFSCQLDRGELLDKVDVMRPLGCQAITFDI